MNILIIGSGPAGLHLSKSLLKWFEKLVNISMIEKRVLHGGLLWLGVAPDHYEIKNIIS